MTACAASPENPKQIRIGDQSFNVEVKKTEQERATGMMFRNTINDDEGMWFVFPTEDKHGFWMKNTLVPLDIIWVSEDLEVVAIKRNARPCITPENNPNLCTMHIPRIPAKYVLEVKANSFLGKTGDIVEAK